MIILKNISVVFGEKTPTERTALRSINLRIGEGEFITVIGSNGAGKSTFLNVTKYPLSPINRAE